MKKPRKARGPVATVVPVEPFHHRLGRLLLFVHLALSPLVFSTRTVEAFEYNKVAILTVTAILLSAGVLSLAVQRWAGNGAPVESLGPGLRRLAREPLAVGMALFLVSSVISTAFSISTRTSFYGTHESFAGLITMTAYGVLFFATRSLCRTPEDFRGLLVATVIGFAGATAYAIVQLTGLDPISWGRTSGYAGVSRIFSTMGNPNFLAAFLAMGFPIVAFFAVRSFRQRRPLVAGSLALTAVVGAALVIVLASRGAWFGFGGMIGVLLVGGGIVAGERRLVLWFGTVSVLAVLVSVLALTTFPSGQLVLSPVRERVARALDVTNLTGDARWEMWRSSLQMLKDHPVTGVGLDSFQLAFERYRTTEYWRREWKGTPTKAHSEVLHILATQGLLGGAAMVLIVVGTAVAFWRALRRVAEDRLLVVAALACAAGFYLQDVVGFTVAGCGTLFVTVAALLSRLGEPLGSEAASTLPQAGRRHSPVETTPLSRVAQGAIVVVALLLIHQTVYVPFLANAQARLGATYLPTDPARAAAHFEQAVRTDSSKDLYWTQLGSANETVARSERDASARRVRLKRAEEAFTRSIELVPANSYNWANRARLRMDLAKDGPPMSTPEQSYADFEQALVRDPNNADFYTDAANAALTLGDRTRAERWATTSAGLYDHFGPPRSQLGYLALTDAIALRDENKEPESRARLEEAARVLQESLDREWYGDESGRAIAASNLTAARTLLNPLE